MKGGGGGGSFDILHGAQELNGNAMLPKYITPATPLEQAVWSADSMGGVTWVLCYTASLFW
jgi:hypothetical protein